MQPRPPLGLPEFLELHPWDPESVARDKPLEYLWCFDLAADPDLVWDRVVDTSRMNRALKLKEMHFEERDGAFHGWSVNGGLRHEWVEVPWSWSAGEWLEMRRIYRRGFSRMVRSVYRVERSGGGGAPHRLYVYFGWIPRGLLARAAIALGMIGLEKGYRRVIGEVEAHIEEARPPPFRAPAPALSPEAEARLERIRRGLAKAGSPAATTARIIEYVTTADEMDAYRIQVRRLAHAWGQGERDLLVAFLEATRAGLLELSWDVICPHCRGVREEARTLGDLPRRGSCEVCDIDFETDAENAVEITFHVHPAIRAVPKVYYCSAEPAQKPHIRAQLSLPPGERLRVAPRLAPGIYRMRRRGGEDGAVLEVAEDGDAGPLEWRASRPPPARRVRPAPTLVVDNDGAAPETFVLEEMRWADVALRPAQLFNLQEFRDMFSEEFLAAEVQLAVGEQTVLFTDMVGSTRFYAEHGDPDAFVAVKRHFVEIYEIVRRSRGAVVKTIGDAAMAAFSSAADAVRAAREIHRRFPPSEAPRAIRLRVSLHTGPCIAVNLNSNIDYFGSAVNLAAKLQGPAGAGDIVMSEQVFAAPEVAALLAEEGATLERAVLELPIVGAVAYAMWRTDPA